MSVPAFVPGELLLGSDVNDWLAWQVAYKTGPTSRANTTALADDPDLSLPVEGGAVYEMRAGIFYDGTGGTQGIQWGYDAPAGTVAQVATWCWQSGVLLYAANSYATAIAWADTSSNTANELLVQRANVQAGGAGPWAFRWAQHAGSATATSVVANSWMMLRRVA